MSETVKCDPANPGDDVTLVETSREILVLEQETQAAITAWLHKILNSICPSCNKAITKEQVGNCVYGSCGHRLYQGQLKKEIAEEDEFPQVDPAATGRH